MCSEADAADFAAWPEAGKGFPLVFTIIYIVFTMYLHVFALDIRATRQGLFDAIIVDSTDQEATKGRSSGLWSQSFFEACRSLPSL